MPRPKKQQVEENKIIEAKIIDHKDEKLHARGFNFLFGLIILTWIIMGSSIYMNISLTKKISEKAMAEKSDAIAMQLSSLDARVSSLESKIFQLVPNDDPEKIAPPSMPDENEEKINEPVIEAPEGAQNNSVEPYNKQAAHDLLDYEKNSIMQGLSEVNDKTIQLEDKIFKLSEEMEKTKLRSNANNLLISAINLRDAVINSKSFDNELDALHNFSNEDPVILKNIDAIKQYARNGVPSIDSLYNDFDKIADNILNSARETKQNPTILDKTALKFSSIVSIRKIRSSDPEPESVDGIIAETDKYLKKADVKSAVKEMEKLNGHSALIAEKWINDAYVYINSRNASDDIYTYISRMAYNTENNSNSENQKN